MRCCSVNAHSCHAASIEFRFPFTKLSVRICEQMAPRLVFVSSVLLVLCCAVAASDFDDSQNPIRMVSDRLRELESEVTRVVGRTPHALQFARFAHRYGKSYKTAEEMRRRYAIFLETLERIESTNRKGLSYKLGVNQFSDWTWEEFRKRRLLSAPQNCSATTTQDLKLSHALLPESKDWRDEGVVSPVKDQGSCGSCWTFSTTGALESAYAQAFRKNISLSEQQLLDCAGGFNNFGCNGGLPSQAFEYIKYNRGLESEASYPYKQVEGECQFKFANAVVNVSQVVNITQGGEDDLKSAVALIRPVSVAFEVDGNFRDYTHGVYSSETCGSGPEDVNHAVLAVGYGVENGTPFWILKNSWGENWGDHGFFKMLRGVNMCGVATCASYPTIV